MGYITNHAYLDNPTFRGMRWRLANTFDDIYIVDLHGNSKKKETALDGSKDENVFDIMQGVSIIIGVKKMGSKKKIADLEKKANLAAGGYASVVANEGLIKSLFSGRNRTQNEDAAKKIREEIQKKIKGKDKSKDKEEKEDSKDKKERCKSLFSLQSITCVYKSTFNDDTRLLIL